MAGSIIQLNNKLYSSYEQGINKMSYTNSFQTGKVYNYLEADTILQGRNKNSKKLANNTYLQRRGNAIVIKLHNTDIITINKNDTYTLNSGGWLSLTTKSRLNEFSPVSISQKSGIWYLRDGSLYSDKMTVDISGDNIAGPSDPVQYENKLKAIKKQARAYAKAYVKELQADKIDYPSGGDCWACAMKGPKGQEAFPGSGHIQDHLTELYFVPSLLVNAGRAAGYRDDQIGLMGLAGHRVFIDPENNIYKYVVKQLRRDI